MRGKCDKQEFCLHLRAVYTAKQKLPSVARACIFAAQRFIFPSQYQYFWGEIVWDKRWHPISFNHTAAILVETIDFASFGSPCPRFEAFHNVANKGFNSHGNKHC